MAQPQNLSGWTKKDRRILKDDFIGSLRVAQGQFVHKRRWTIRPHGLINNMHQYVQRVWKGESALLSFAGLLGCKGGKGNNNMMEMVS